MPEREAIGVREFARREGCDPKVVMRAKHSGHLQCDPSGRPFADQVKGAWRKSNRRGDTADPPRVDKPSVDGEAAANAAKVLAQLAAPGGVMTVADAEALKETYLAKLRQLEYETKAGRVVLIDDAVAALERLLADLRTKLLAVPAEQAPRLARLKSPAEMQDALQAIITECLEGLTIERALPARP